MKSTTLFSLIIVFLQIISVQGLWGQERAYRHLTIQEGLPSSFIYDIIQDDNGFLWVADQEAVSTFDGNKFTKVDLDLNGNERGSVVELEKDSKGRIWFHHLSGHYSMIDNDKVTPVERPFSEPVGLAATSFFEDRNGGIWLAESEAIFLFRKNNILEYPDTSFTIPALTGKKIFCETDEGVIHILSRGGVAKVKNYKFETTEFPSNFSMENFTIINGQLFSDQLYFTTAENVFQFDLNSGTYKVAFPQMENWWAGNVLRISKISDDEAFVSTRNGVVHIKNLMSNPDFQIYFEGKSIGDMVTDKEGNFWFCSQNDGLYMLPANEVDILQNGRTVHSISSRGSDLILGAENCYATLINSEKEVVFDVKLKEENYQIYDILTTPDSLFFLTSRDVYVLDNNSNVNTYGVVHSFKAGFLDAYDQIWVSSASFTGRYSPERELSFFNNVRSYAVLPIGKDEAWLGSIKGLIYYKNGKTNLIDNPVLANVYIEDLKLDEMGNLWASTNGNGVFRMGPDKGLKNFTLEQGLASNKTSKLSIDKNYVWVCTNKGLNQINRSDETILYLGQDDGLPSKEVTDICKIENTVYVSTAKGVAYFDDAINLKQEPPKTYITNLKINERDTIIHKDYTLEHFQKNIKIDFTGITFKNADYLEYEYQMEPIDKGWVASNINVAQYPSLPSGDYTFSLKAKSINTGWSEPETITFAIKKPWWETYTFYFVISLLSFVLGAKLFQLVIGNIKERNAVRAQLVSSQLTALRAQMNPHFLFNALNSIQEFIINEDKREANRYLSDFSNLMRNILQMSDQDEITLQQELKALDLYLGLEALRFESNFEYSIQIDEKIDTNVVKIPPMLIQPFVENAIKHGLLHKKGNKKLYIRFNEVSGFLNCEIEDNGIGRKRSEIIKNNNAKVYPSKATSLTENRLKLLTIAQNRRMSHEVEDLVDNHGNAIGTRVKIAIKLKSKQ